MFLNAEVRGGFPSLLAMYSVPPQIKKHYNIFGESSNGAKFN